MQIQINTDHHIPGSDARDDWARGVVDTALAHHADHVTRVEVHFSLESAGKPGAGDKRCTVEARLNGHAPVVASHDAGALDVALNGALHRLSRALDRAVGRADKHGHDARPPADVSGDDFVPSSAPF